MTPPDLARYTRLRTEADDHRAALAAQRSRDLRVRLGWTLVELGLRLATPRPVPGPA
ncbi:hypothetical protein [Streptomyces sp. enrichment culture]|uniref:hypothetical protein n=1 Tax=Streptomyces sp. enrichment culture TaxID=1795815 RepID=UPI003F557562